MNALSHALTSVAIIFLLTATGYFCAAKGWMSEESKRFLSKLLMNIAVPAMVVYGFKQNLSLELLESSGKMLLAGFCACAVDFALAFALGRALRLPRKKLGVFVMMCSVSNCIFIGLAMCTELFGEVCLPQVMLYWVVSTCFMQLGGISLIRWSGTGGAFTGKTVLDLLKTPSILATIVSVGLVVFEIPVPGIVMSYCKYLNGIVTPLALLLTGYIIHDIGLKRLRLDSLLTIVMGFRFVAAPVICLGFCVLFGVTGLARNVYLVEAAMPVVTQTVVAAAAYGGDEELAAQGAAISTLGCFIVTPVLAVILL